MSIRKRIGRLLSADIHGLLDVFEDPQETCKQAVREMEEELAQIKIKSASMQQALEKVEDQRRRVLDRRSEIEEQLAICLGNSDEALTRSVLRRKLEQEKLLECMAKQKDELSAEQIRTLKQVSEYEDRLESIKSKLACFCEERFSGVGNKDSWNESLTVSEEEIDLALLKIKTANSQISKRGDQI